MLLLVSVDPFHRLSIMGSPCPREVLFILSMYVAAAAWWVCVYCTSCVRTDALSDLNQMNAMSFVFSTVNISLN